MNTQRTPKDESIEETSRDQSSHPAAQDHDRSISEGTDQGTDQGSGEGAAHRESQWQRQHGVEESDKQSLKGKTGAEADADAGEPTS